MTSAYKYTVSLCLAGLLWGAANFTWEVPSEAVFPVHCIYYISTFYLTFPKAGVLRSFFTTLGICLGDLFLTCSVLDFSGNFSFLVLQYFLIYSCFLILSTREIYSALKNEALRTTLFAGEALWRANFLVWSIASLVASLGGISYESVLVGICMGALKVAVAPMVYLLDSFFCLDIPVRDISLRGLKDYVKQGVVVSIASLVLATYTGNIQVPELIGKTYANIFASLYFMMWYAKDSVEYGEFFRR